MSAAKTDRTDLVVDTAQLAALTILESGGETSRAEETASILCESAGRKEADVFALPSGIFITAEREDGSKVSSVKRIKSRSVNLFKVHRVNAYSREFAEGKLSLEELHDKLIHLRSSILYSKGTIILATGCSAAMFTLLFEEALGWVVLFDMALAFLAAFFAQCICLSSRMRGAYLFTVTFLASITMALFAVTGVSLCRIGNLGCIIIGAIMPLLPGLALTNAIRDTVMGDIVSGTVRLVETLLIAIAIAGGVGVVLGAYISLIGGVA